MKTKKDNMTNITIFFVSILICLFVIYPLARVIYMSLNPDGYFSLSEYKYILSKNWLRRTFFNSLKLGVIVATTGTIVGYLAAYSLNKVKISGKKFFRQIVMLPIISPPFMLTISII